MAEEQTPEWRIFVARAESLGGRSLRHHLARLGLAYERWPEAGTALPPQGPAPRGLLLPLAGPVSGEEPWGQPAQLAELQRLLREALQAGLDRAVVMLPAPDKAVFALCGEFAKAGLSCTAICAATGEICGAERPYDPAGTVEELLDTFARAAHLGKKRVQLPCRDEAVLGLIHWEDLAAAAIFALRSDREIPPLYVMGLPARYGDLAQLAARAASFGGGIRYGRKLCPALPSLSALPPMREMTSANRLRLDLAFPYLLGARARGGRLKVSACVIMRDNEEDIGRCLASLSRADELIVVDTGSRDKSVEIARRYTDKISHFTWVDDFAAAKNYALSQATGDWIVFLDSDESFTEATAPGVKAVCEDYDMPGGRESLVVRLLNVDLAGAPLPGQSEGAVTRFLKAGQHFTGVVHENPRMPDGRPPSSATLPKERALLLHTGYAPERRLEKKARNEALIMNAEAAGKEVPFADYYHARIAYNNHNWERAREAAKAMIYHGEPVGTMRFETYRVWYRSCQRLEDEEGLLEARAAMRRDMPDMPDSWALEGVSLWNEGKEEEGAPLLLKALELSHEFLQRNPAEQDDIAADTEVIGKELARFYEERGEAEQAAYVRGLAGL